MKLQRASGDEELDISATYLLVRGQYDGLTIAAQIDHQDLASLVRERQGIEG
jgi:hypothetical protein